MVIGVWRRASKRLGRLELGRVAYRAEVFIHFCGYSCNMLALEMRYIPAPGEHLARSEHGSGIINKVSPHDQMENGETRCTCPAECTYT